MKEQECESSFATIEKVCQVNQDMVCTNSSNTAASNGSQMVAKD